ncbi:MAG: hypothetical protein R3281_09075 [Balneolaceae bacterium]|nr:hypothetical protein [Balneolaceae bacterium]
MTFTRKHVYLAVSAFILVLLLVRGFWPSPITVSLEEARIAPLEVTIEEEGKTRVMDRYTISAPVAGYALRIQHEVGDTVASGQVLFTIQPVPDLISARQREVAEAQLDAANARLRQAEEQLALATEEYRQANKELQRIEDLYKQGVGSEQGLDQVRLAAKRTNSQRNSAEFAVNVAEYEVKAAESAVRTFQFSGNRDDY